MKGKLLMLLSAIAVLLSTNIGTSETLTVSICLRPLSEFPRNKEGAYLDAREDTGYLSFCFVHTEADTSKGEEYFTVWVKPFLTSRGKIRGGNGGYTYVFDKKTVFTGPIGRHMLPRLEGKKVKVSAKIAHIPSPEDSLSIVKTVAYELNIRQ